MKKRGKKKFNLFLLIICFFVTYFTAFIGSTFTMRNTDSPWYLEIKPTITPPNWVFPIVWNILFFLISISLYLLITNAKTKYYKKMVLVTFGINLFLNALWSYLYFGIKNPSAALIEIIPLEISAFAMIIVAWKVNKTAAWLLIPYSLWLGFAIILNYLTVFS
jgi:tryptophan-rich sensory protein